MEITDLQEEFVNTFCCCLEDWSDEMMEAGSHKAHWFQQMRDQGLRVKLAVEDGNACGMIQYVPVELSMVHGEDLYFVLCVWVHGYKEGIGNRQKKGMGTALLRAAETDVREMGKKGIAVWGVSMPFWMKASWFRNHGYRKVDKNGSAVLLWKSFTVNAQPPHWIREVRRPQPVAGKVTVSGFINGWCPARNIVFERAKRAAQEFGDAVEFKEIYTNDRDVFLDWGISDGVFIDGKQVNSGPPPSYEKIRKKIAKRVRKL